MRRVITPSVPPSLRNEVIGSLIASDDPADKGQDMVSVQLPSGVRIQAGWYPDSDPEGKYRVMAACGLWYLCAPIYSVDVDQAAEDFAELCTRFYYGSPASIVYETDYDTVCKYEQACA